MVAKRPGRVNVNRSGALWLLHVDNVKSVPLAKTLEIRSHVIQIKGRRVLIGSTVYAAGLATARTEVVALQMPEGFGTARA